jgi:hypothetical protein
MTDTGRNQKPLRKRKFCFQDGNTNFFDDTREGRQDPGNPVGKKSS